MADILIFWSQCRQKSTVETNRVSELFSSTCPKDKNVQRDLKYTSSVTLIVNVFVIILLFYTLIASFYSISWPCYNVNDCAVWLVSWNHITVAIFLVISSATYRRSRVPVCLNMAAILFQKFRKRNAKFHNVIRYYFYALTTIFIAKTVIALSLEKNHFVFLLYSLSCMVPVSIECTFMILCSVVENVCYEITDTLRKLSTNRNTILLSRSIKDLADLHLQAVNLLRKITNCFARDLLIDLTFNMIWFIIYIYVTVVSLCTPGTNPKKNVCLIVELLFLAVRVSFLSYSVSRIEYEAHNILIELRNFLCTKLNDTCVKLTNQFLDQIMRNEMKVTICGVFNINMSFMRGVISLSTTYLIVFIQYGFGETSKNANVTNTTVGE